MTCTPTLNRSHWLLLLFGFWLAQSFASRRDFGTLRAQRHSLLHRGDVKVAGELMYSAAGCLGKLNRQSLAVALPEVPELVQYGHHCSGPHWRIVPATFQNITGGTCDFADVNSVFALWELMAVAKKAPRLQRSANRPSIRRGSSHGALRARAQGRPAALGHPRCRLPGPAREL